MLSWINPGFGATVGVLVFKAVRNRCRKSVTLALSGASGNSQSMSTPSYPKLSARFAISFARFCRSVAVSVAARHVAAEIVAPPHGKINAKPATVRLFEKPRAAGETQARIRSPADHRQSESFENMGQLVVRKRRDVDRLGGIAVPSGDIADAHVSRRRLHVFCDKKEKEPK